MAPRRRSLADLYVQSTTVDVPVPDGEEPMQVLIVKMSLPERETLVRKANKKKAQTLLMARDKESDHYQNLLAEVIEWPTETLTEWSIMEALSEMETSQKHRLMAEDEWANDDYLEGLFDAWNDDLKERYEDDPEDEEAAKVFAELNRFTEQLQARIDTERQEMVAVQGAKTRGALEDETVGSILKLEAEQAWAQEARFLKLYYSARQPTDGPVRKAPRIFETLDEVKETHESILKLLDDAYEELTVDPLEGKDSPVKPDSSPPSDSPVEAEADSDSGPKGPID